MRSIAILIALSFGPSLTVAGDSLPADVQRQLTKATVLVNSTTTDGPRRMAGFLVESENGFGLIVTSARAVQQQNQPARQIECVFHSGVPQEYAVPAKVVAIDKARDVAVLQVNRGDLPTPIKLPEKSEVREGMTVYACGFSSLDVSTDGPGRPAVAISTGTVGFVRRDDDGNILFIQTSGAMAPENTGGPVVDAAGRLVGTSVTRLKGTSIGMAGPVGNVRQLMDRKLAKRSGGQVR